MTLTWCTSLLFPVPCRSSAQSIFSGRYVCVNYKHSASCASSIHTRHVYEALSGVLTSKLHMTCILRSCPTSPPPTSTLLKSNSSSSSLVSLLMNSSPPRDIISESLRHSCSSLVVVMQYRYGCTYIHAYTRRKWLPRLGGKWQVVPSIPSLQMLTFKKCCRGAKLYCC